MDPGQATMVVFPDTMYTCWDTQEGGGVKIDNFFSYLILSQQNIAYTDPEGGQGAQIPLEKQKFFGIL